MLYAKLDSPATYTPLVGHPVWEEALAALRALHADTPEGIIELRGKDMFVNLHSYDTKPDFECRFEGHREMVDVQYIIRGGELIDWQLKLALQADESYNDETDFQFYHASVEKPPARVHLKAGCFALFFPEDGHRPQINDGMHLGVYKAVVKIKRELVEN